MFRYDVSHLGDLHPRIRAEDWRSPLIHRLLNNCEYRESEAAVSVGFKAPLADEEECQFVLGWTGLGADFERCLNTYQGPVLMEFAGMGLACIAVHGLAELEITEVTMRGQRADYWLGDRSLLLEVSARQDGDLDRLFQEKSRQLLANPFGKSGYVFAAHFGRLKARLWFCRGSDR